jgi:hypothetical protein
LKNFTNKKKIKTINNYKKIKTINNYKKIKTMNNYFENSEIFDNFSEEPFTNMYGDIFSNAGGGDVVSNVAKAVGDTVQGVGNIALAKSNREVARNELQREVDVNCGGKRPKFGKKKKASYDACATSVAQKVLQTKAGDKDYLLQQQKSTFAQQDKKDKISARNMYIGVGVVVLIIATVIYLKKTS